MMACVVDLSLRRKPDAEELAFLKYLLPPEHFERFCELAVEWNMRPAQAAAAIIITYINAEGDA